MAEAPLDTTKFGLRPGGEGWFVMSAKDSRWRDTGGYGMFCNFEGKRRFPGLGINLNVLRRGEPMGLYHRENAQEDFLVLAGEALLVIEGEERRLRQWDFVHCPPGTKHTIVGAGDAPCMVLSVGARDRSRGPDWGAYTVDETALRHGAGVERETSEPAEAYARFPRGKLSRYRRGWLP